MEFIELARSSYSCKSFDSRQISKEQLDSILEADVLKGSQMISLQKGKAL